MKVKRIMVATDFSAAGDLAVHEAAAWAERFGSAIRVVHVAPPKRWLGSLWGAKSADIAVIYRHAADALRHASEGVQVSGKVEVSTALLSGRASTEILRAADDFKSDLLVIGAYGERGRMSKGPTLGGTAAKLVRLAASPLLIMRKLSTNASNVVLAAVDLTPVSGDVLNWARAGVIDGQLHVLHAYEVPFAERLQTYSVGAAAIDVYASGEQTRRERQLGKLLSAHGDNRVDRIVVRGDAIKQVFKHVQRIGANLVVVGQHAPRKRRAASAGFGSVCRYVTTFSPTNVLVIPVR